VAGGLLVYDLVIDGSNPEPTSGRIDWQDHRDTALRAGIGWQPELWSLPVNQALPGQRLGAADLSGAGQAGCVQPGSGAGRGRKSFYGTGAVDHVGDRLQRPVRETGGAQREVADLVVS
jgi:hypothetical protein